MLLLQSPVLLLLFFFLPLLLVAQVAMKIDIREGGVSFGSCSRRIVAGAAASRRGGGSDAAWQLNCSREQSTSNRDPLPDHLLNTSAFFLYTHTYINDVEINAGSSVGDSQIDKEEEDQHSGTSTPDSGRPKSATFE